MFSFAALIVGVKAGGTLALLWLPPWAAALVAGATAALVLVGFTTAFGGERPAWWRVAAFGVVAALLFVALRALADPRR